MHFWFHFPALSALVEFLHPFSPFKFSRQNHPIMDYALNDVLDVLDKVMYSEIPAVKHAYEQLQFVCSLQDNTNPPHNSMKQLIADIHDLKMQAHEFRELVNEYRYMSPVKTEMKNYIMHIIATDPPHVFSSMQGILVPVIDNAINRRIGNG